MQNKKGRNHTWLRPFAFGRLLVGNGALLSTDLR